MDFRAEYEKWCTDPYFDEATKAELKAIAGDDKEIEDRFYRTLEFDVLQNYMKNSDSVPNFGN